jgi:3-oxoadipate enol-lactonase
MRLHHRLEGRAGAPTVVLSGSLGTTLEMWQPQADSLAGRFSVLRYDRRGHGRSPVPPGPCSIDDLGGDALELLDALELERVSFCGLSLGGAEGMWLAARAPDRIDRLVLACTAPRFPPRETWEERARTVRAEGTEAIADVVMERWFTAGFRSREPETVARFRAMLAGTPDEGYAASCDALAELDLGPELASISAAALVVTGEHDPVVTPEVGDQLAAGIAHARHVVIAGAAHLASIERAEAFTEALLDHLAAVPEEAL